jgi:hypothetical protein
VGLLFLNCEKNAEEVPRETTKTATAVLKVKKHKL